MVLLSNTPLLKVMSKVYFQITIEYDAIFDVHVYERERVSQRVCWDLGVSVVCACAVCAGLTDTVAPLARSSVRCVR